MVWRGIVRTIRASARASFLVVDHCDPPPKGQRAVCAYLSSRLATGKRETRRARFPRAEGPKEKHAKSGKLMSDDVSLSQYAKSTQARPSTGSRRGSFFAFHASTRGVPGARKTPARAANSSGGDSVAAGRPLQGGNAGAKKPFDREGTPCLPKSYRADQRSATATAAL